MSGGIVRPQCIITGCDLISEDFSWVHGDLHKVGDTWVFNAVTAKDGVVWNYSRRLSQCPSLVMIPGHSYFERRGVFVIDKTSAELDKAARAYLRYAK